MTLFFPLLPSLPANLPEAVGRKPVLVGGFLGTSFGKKAKWQHACAWTSKFQHSPAIVHMQIKFPDFFYCHLPVGVLLKFLVPAYFKNTKTRTGMPVPVLTASRQVKSSINEILHQVQKILVRGKYKPDCNKPSGFRFSEMC